MKKITLVLGLMLAVSASFAQNYYSLSGTGSSAPYFQSLDEDYEIALTTNRNDANSEINDVLSDAQTIPFAFNYYGTDFTSYKVSDNGYITFDVAETVSNPNNTNLPDASAPNNAIMAFWDDLELEQNRTFLFAVVNSTIGTAPNRSHIIKWFQANHKDRNSELDELLYFGIVLHEQGGFDIVHEAQLTLGTAYTESATIGCTNADGSEVVMVEGPSAAFPGVTQDGPEDDRVYSFLVGPQRGNDLSITNVDMIKDAILADGSITTRTTVRNMGSETITSLKLNYIVGNGTPVTDSYTTSIATGAERTFTHTTAWTPAAAGEYDFNVFASEPNGGADENTENDNEQSFVVSVYESAPVRIPFYEIFTSSTCGPCTPGNRNFHNIIDGARETECTYIKYQQNFPGSGDPYASTQSVGRRSYYGVNSIPRMELDGQWDGNANSFTAALHNEYKSAFSLVELDATFDKWAQSVVTTIDVSAIKDLNNVSVYAAVFETYNDKNVKTNGETEFLHVFKRFLTPVEGEEVNLTKDNALTRSYQVDFSGDYLLAPDGQSANWININRNHDVEDFDNLKVVVWVQDNSTREILQSTYATEIALGVDDIQSKLNAAVSPNPTNGLTNISMALTRNSDVQVSLTNTAGQVVNSFTFDNVNAGDNTLTVNLNEHSAGVYFFNIKTNEGSTTQKIVVAN